jgi:hypothetical protein
MMISLPGTTIAHFFATRKSFADPAPPTAVPSLWRAYTATCSLKPTDLKMHMRHGSNFEAEQQNASQGEWDTICSSLEILMC